MKTLTPPADPDDDDSAWQRFPQDLALLSKVLGGSEDLSGLNLNVIVPARREPETNLFTPAQFLKSEEGQWVTCPAGQTSHSRQYDQAKHATTNDSRAAGVCGTR